MIYILKTIKHWWKNFKKTQINGNTFHVDGWVDLILLKCPHYPEHSTDSMQSLSKPQWHYFLWKWKTDAKIHMETQKSLDNQRNLKQEKPSLMLHTFWFDFEIYY